MAVAADRKASRDANRDERGRRRRLAIFLAHRLPCAGGRRAGRGGAAPARSLRDVLDRRWPHSDRRGARRRARIFRALHAALCIPAFLALLAGLAWAALSVSVDALSGRGRAAPAEAERAARGDDAGGGGAARKRERDRPLSVPDRRGRRHGDDGRARPCRDPDRRAGRRPARGRRRSRSRCCCSRRSAGLRRADATVLRACF